MVIQKLVRAKSFQLSKPSTQTLVAMPFVAFGVMGYQVSLFCTTVGLDQIAFFQDTGRMIFLTLTVRCSKSRSNEL